MNWRRGLFRLWAIGSIAWVSLSIAVTWLNYANIFSDPSLPPPPSGFVPYYEKFHQVAFWVGDVLAPPIAAGILLLAAFWIISGFAQRKNVQMN